MGTGSSSGTPVAGLETAVADLRAIVGAEHVRASIAEDGVDGVLPSSIIEPGGSAELAKVLKVATEAGLHVMPRGGATKLDWGNPAGAANLIMSTRRLNRVTEHAWADMTATV